MLPDSPQNIVVVRAPSPSVHYIAGSMISDTSSSLLLTPSHHQQTTVSTVQQPIHTLNQPVSESWCLTSVKVIRVSTKVLFLTSSKYIYYIYSTE